MTRRLSHSTRWNVARLHLSSAEIAQMSRDEAIARMQECWSKPG